MGLDVGEQAPDFELSDQHGQDVSLSKFRGAKNVIAVFYPFAFSGVCTGEMREIRERLPTFQNDGVQLLALSCDPLYALRVFADQEGLTFPLLSDFWPHGEVAKAYGVFDADRGCAGRATFVIDRDGVVRWSVHNALPDARSLAEYERVLEGI
jgi:mycoredoxin-dependent peroxiredoxin